MILVYNVERLGYTLSSVASNLKSAASDAFKGTQLAESIKQWPSENYAPLALMQVISGRSFIYSLLYRRSDWRF